MRKEVLVAIIIGFGLGLVITFGIWTANKALKNTSTDSAETPAPLEEEIETALIPASTLELLITSPENNTVSEKETIEIVGQTAVKAIISIIYPNGEKLLEAGEDGNFSTEISLVGGDNQIKISAFSSEGDEISKTLTIVYSTAKI